jgi:hypothetical protein
LYRGGFFIAHGIYAIHQIIIKAKISEIQNM